MKFVTFRDAGGTVRVGSLAGEKVVDMTSALPANVFDMHSLIKCCTPALLAELREAEASLPGTELGRVKLLAPIPRPVKNIFCVGKNYHEHAEEFHRSGFDASAGAGANAVPEFPIVFSKPATTVIGPGDVIPGSLDPTSSVDYENELAVVIGRDGRNISKENAMAHVFGYTIVNDITSRVLQQRHKQWLLGKGIDGFCPMGPTIVTKDEIDNLDELELVTLVNGEARQRAKVKDMIFDVPTLISVISRSITLEAGDIIATGTPAGVGIGFTPPRYLVKNDVIELSISQIGTLSNTVA